MDRRDDPALLVTDRPNSNKIGVTMNKTIVMCFAGIERTEGKAAEFGKGKNKTTIPSPERQKGYKKWESNPRPQPCEGRVITN